MASPVFSIIIPMKNASSFVGETIQSVLSQSFQNYECIVIDDCSTDNGKSVQSVLALTKDDPRFKIIELQCGKGSSGARNEGLKSAGGKFISFLDADDLWKPSYLETMYNHILNCSDSTAAIFFCGYRRMDDECKNPVLPDYVCTGKKTFKDFIRHCPVFPSICIIDSAKLDKPVFFREELKSLRDDYVYFLDILSQGKSAFGFEDILVDYRMRTDSMTASKSKMIKPQWNVYRKILHFNFFKSCFYLFCWASNGIKKYFIKR